MIQPTQTMECTTEVPYISIYDRPKRPRGRPKTSTLTDEEKAQRAREANSRCYYNNHEHYLLQKRSYKQSISKTKMKFEKNEF